jgi:hypothetical protein
MIPMATSGWPGTLAPARSVADESSHAIGGDLVAEDVRKQSLAAATRVHP